MNNIIIEKINDGITDNELATALKQSISNKGTLKKVLLIPPDFTRMNSGAGIITAIYYELLKDTCEVYVLPALGTHMPMSHEEIDEFFGKGIPKDRFINHNWRTDVVKIGEVPKEYVSKISEGLVNNSIDVEVNKHLLDKSYDLIISIGQVVPHEVVGMANYNKNVFVGCGGSNMINQSHMLGAFFGMERIMGKDNTPVRKVFDYAEQHFAMNIPLMYVLTVTLNCDCKTRILGLYIGRDRVIFEKAVLKSQQENINFVEKAPKKVVVFLDPKEFKSTWLGNKAIYRTRMAIADDGELIVLAPGVRMFGEDKENDVLIKKYGYVGRKRVLELSKDNCELQCNLSVAAHLIHGSSDGRFSITYAVEHLTREEVEGANFIYASYKDMIKKYNPETLKDGFNTVDGEEIYYISNPALGLWAEKSKFYNASL